MDAVERRIKGIAEAPKAAPAPVQTQQQRPKKKSKKADFYDTW